MLNADGLFIVKGRAQTVLNLGGDKISPEAIELVLSQYPGVIEAAAFSAPNEFGNNEVCAVIASREPIEVAKLRAHCEGRLSRAFVPCKILFHRQSAAQRNGQDRPSPRRRPGQTADGTPFVASGTSGHGQRGLPADFKSIFFSSARWTLPSVPRGNGFDDEYLVVVCSEARV